MAKETKAYAQTGTYIGFEDSNGIVNFLGIPYVQPPERWKRAQPLPRSDKEIEAKEFGPICWQPILPEEHPEDISCSEDCLTLNIWTDDVTVKGKPVMFWIHGGCYFTGSNRIPYYCNDKFAADCRDIVFVNINYRLGPFGSMDVSSLDQTGEYEGSGNLQTYDQMAALKWVYENIEAFGGDPKNITVYGQSAGSFSTATLMLIPEANQYISKTICESSGYANNMKTVAYSKRIGERFVELAHASTMEDLLALSPEEVLRCGMEIFDDLNFPKPFEGVKDGKLIPLNPYAALRSGIAKHITMMSGTVSGEYDTASYQKTDEEILERIYGLFGTRMTPALLKEYIENDQTRDYHTALLDLRNDFAVRMPVLNTLEAQSAAGATTYLYYFDYKPEEAELRTQHLFEIPFFNDKLDIPVHMDLTFDQPVQGKCPDQSLVAQIQGCWANFARTGKPGGAHIGTDWPPYTLEEKVTMVMHQGAWSPQRNFRKRDTELVQSLMNE